MEWLELEVFWISDFFLCIFECLHYAMRYLGKPSLQTSFMYVSHIPYASQVHLCFDHDPFQEVECGIVHVSCHTSTCRVSDLGVFSISDVWVIHPVLPVRCSSVSPQEK